ncbi:hypothetical protein UFOVP466_33 [uncultured Caudovirales phage]|uniref:Uncharacterized protein n=1 Tax=uncultured Caudovirales phage TaxID=2100421 RepID=A0A6J5T1Y2_9CAUD|nr:hypothetical protein UFOVP466_33 [uncultured Caudovirales phage]CAB4180688.1 hypothetical protein UFOVP1045_80 [uncultured Caudovirales phage]CAB4190106.1 hypothetical protein UFOVP1194_34 [uncultured Caudovirales phage]CAB4221793.1 hypothetical protein UFOVP1641_30 [uncultured Caudovirales phage]
MMASLFSVEMPCRDGTAEQWVEWLTENVPCDTLRDTAAILSRPSAGSGLRDLCVWWNELHDAGLVSHSVKPDNPAQELKAAWAAFLKNDTARECLSDLEAVRSEIERASFVKGGWFRLEKLLRGACNGAGVPICRVLIDGGYRDDKSRKQADDPRGSRTAASEYLARFGQG